MAMAVLSFMWLLVAGSSLDLAWWIDGAQRLFLGVAESDWLVALTFKSESEPELKLLFFSSLYNSEWVLGAAQLLRLGCKGIVSKRVYQRSIWLEI
jgi:hypothetical protein